MKNPNKIHIKRLKRLRKVEEKKRNAGQHALYIKNKIDKILHAQPKN